MRPASGSSFVHAYVREYESGIGIGYGDGIVAVDVGDGTTRFAFFDHGGADDRLAGVVADNAFDCGLGRKTHRNGRENGQHEESHVLKITCFHAQWFRIL